MYASSRKRICFKRAVGNDRFAAAICDVFSASNNRGVQAFALQPRAAL